MSILFKRRVSGACGSGSDSGQRGFTLAEVLVALAILSIALLGIGQMQLAALSGNTYGGSTSVALQLAQAKIDGLKALIPEGATDWPSPQLDIGGPYQDPTDPSPGFSRSWTVETFGTDSRNRLVTVTVTWASGARRASMRAVLSL